MSLPLEDISKSEITSKSLKNENKKDNLEMRPDNSHLHPSPTRKEIMDKLSQYRWPPTLDATKFKSMMKMKVWWQDKRRYIPTIAIPIGIILFIIVGTVVYEPENPGLSWTAATVILMAIWWITEAIPLPITALLPVALFPLCGVLDGETTASFYMNSTQFLMIGGFLLALAMEKWNLHKRIALKLVLIFGLRPPLILFGMMISTFILSMFISNTAATMMNLPNAIALLSKLEDILPKSDVKKFGTAIFLGLAYSAGVGGAASLVGSPPNLVLGKVLKINFPDAPEVSFAKWMGFGIPVSLVLFVILYLILYVRYCPRKVEVQDISVFRTQYQKLGKIHFEEGVVITTFIMLVILWLFRADINFGSFTVPGWSRIFPVQSFINDGVVAIAVTLPMFAIPAREVLKVDEDEPPKIQHIDEDDDIFLESKAASKRMLKSVDYPKEKINVALRKTESMDNLQVRRKAKKLVKTKIWTGRILGWNLASKIPWDVILLLGGGFALAGAFQESGLSERLGQALIGLKSTVILTCIVVHILTEFTSNTATAQVILPVVASLGVAIEKNPLLLMLPACFSASYAFIMPIGTPANLIVFATRRLELKDMIVNGFLLVISSIIVVVLFTFTLAGPVYGFSSWDLPYWALPNVIIEK